LTFMSTTCSVCGEAVEEEASALCGVCDQRFHLNQRNDVDGRDCGEVWIDEQYLSLRFACFACLGRAAASGEPPIGSGH
jgi:predicted amidophosphoribosyltransferase